VKLQTLKGKTSKLVEIFIQDSSSTTGAGLTGLVFNSASLTAYYYRSGAVGATSITLQTMTLGTWASGGFIVVDGTNMPGLYQLGIPDAALASGASQVIILLKGATNMAPVVLEIQLVNYDPDDGVRMGLTALPNAAAEAAGGLYTRGSGAGQINQPANGQIDANTVKVGGTTQTARDLGASVIAASVTAGVTVTTNNDKTGYSVAAGGIGNGAHAAAELNNIADATLDRNMATGTDSGTDSTVVRTLRQAARASRNKISIAAGVMTVTKEDDATASWTAAITTTAGNPISTVDPT
jgi:hypothetical protein